MTSLDQPTEDVLDSARAGALAIRGGALRAIAYVAAMAASLGSVPFMIRHLGESRYGYYVTVTSILFILGGLTEAGLTQLGLRNYATRTGADRTRFLSHLVGLRLALTISGIAIAVGFTAVTGQPSPVVVGTAIMGFGMIVALTQQTYSVTLEAELRLGWVAALEFTKHATMSAAIIVFVVLGTGLVPFFWAAVIGSVAMLALTWIALRDEAMVGPSFDRREWTTMLREVLPYALAAAVGLIYFRLAVVIMSYVSTEQQTGIYSAAFRPVEAVGVIPWLLVGSAFPIFVRAARDDRERLRYGQRRVFDVALLLGVGMGLSLLVGAPFIIDVIAGRPEFAGSVPVLRILALSLITSFLFVTSAFTMLSLKRYRDMLVANAIAAVTSAGLTLGLAPSLGAEGAAYATLAAEATLVVAYFVLLAREDRHLLPDPWAVARILPPAGAFVGFALLTHLHPLIEVVGGGTLYLAVAFATRAVPGELITALRHRGPGAPSWEEPA